MKNSEKLISDLRIGQPDDSFFHYLHQEQIHKINVYLDDCLLRHSPAVKLVIGPFGTGKSTLMNSILSFYREREVFLSKHVISAGNGIAIREVCANMICEALKSMNSWSGETEKGVIFDPNGAKNHFVSRYANAWNESDAETRSGLIGSLFDYMTVGKVLALKQYMGKHYLPVSCHKLLDNYLSIDLLLDFYGMFTFSQKNVVLAIDEIEAIGTFYKSKSVDFLDFLRQIVDNSHRFCGVFFFGTNSFLTDLDKYPALYDRLVTPVSSTRSTKWDTQDLFPLDGNRVIDALVDLYQEAYGNFSDPHAILNELYALIKNTRATSPRELIRTVIALLDMSSDSMSSFFRSCREMCPQETSIIQDTWAEPSRLANVPAEIRQEEEVNEDLDAFIHQEEYSVPADLWDEPEIEPISESEIWSAFDDKDAPRDESEPSSIADNPIDDISTHQEVPEDSWDEPEIEPISKSEIWSTSDDEDVPHVDNAPKEPRDFKDSIKSFFSDIFSLSNQPRGKENISIDEPNEENLDESGSKDDFYEDFEDLVCKDIKEHPPFQKSLCHGAAKSLPWKGKDVVKKTTKLHVLASELAFAVDNGFAITIDDVFFDPYSSGKNNMSLVSSVDVQKSSIRLTLDLSSIDASDALIIDTVQKWKTDRFRIFQILSQIDYRDALEDIFEWEDAHYQKGSASETSRYRQCLIYMDLLYIAAKQINFKSLEKNIYDGYRDALDHVLNHFGFKLSPFRNGARFPKHGGFLQVNGSRTEYLCVSKR